MVLAPGCYDALGARLVVEAGFPAAYMTGFGSAASRLGRPDVGLMTLSEMVDNARRIAQAVDIPVIADADTVLLSATAAIRSALARIRADGTPIDLLPSLPPFEEFLDFIGMPEIRELEQRFAEG